MNLNLPTVCPIWLTLLLKVQSEVLLGQPSLVRQLSQQAAGSMLVSVLKNVQPPAQSAIKPTHPPQSITLTQIQNVEQATLFANSKPPHFPSKTVQPPPQLSYPASGSASSFLSCSPPTEESSILPAAKTGKRTFFKRGSGILFNQELRSQSLLLQPSSSSISLMTPSQHPSQMTPSQQPSLLMPSQHPSPQSISQSPRALWCWRWPTRYPCWTCQLRTLSSRRRGLVGCDVIGRKRLFSSLWLY